MKGGIYYRRGKRWAKVTFTSGPVDLRPYKYSVGLGARGSQVAHTVKLCEHFRGAERLARNYVDRQLVSW